ncbi:LADA_0B04390g1_1 [Lachancea dasiensis]|uniref:LADA_0B04390g1_1 n=1 Tax=Lachancea dasiensis TaxID=1072105 RepID=A0A1G4ISY7_9SACH|nr:LADA_0B04390g1_1 [Lachancea dasiensis]
MSSRLAKEYKNVAKTLRADQSFSHVLSLGPCSDDNLTHWDAQIMGPADTCYSGYKFTLRIQVTDRYPLEPPKIRFAPFSIPHCNIDFDSGRICLTLLEQEHWSPAWDLLHCVQAIWLLLANPEPDSPLDVDLACLLRAKDYSAHDALVCYYLNGGSHGSRSN